MSGSPPLLLAASAYKQQHAKKRPACRQDALGSQPHELDNHYVFNPEQACCRSVVLSLPCNMALLPRCGKALWPMRSLCETPPPQLAHCLRLPCQQGCPSSGNDAWLVGSSSMLFWGLLNLMNQSYGGGRVGTSGKHTNRQSAQFTYSLCSFAPAHQKGALVSRRLPFTSN